MAGQGFQDQIAARCFAARTLPCSSTTSASMPGNGSVAEPGLSGVTPGSGVIRIMPVSVCHQVSTIGQRPPPIAVVPDPGFRIDRLTHRTQ